MYEGAVSKLRRIFVQSTPSALTLFLAVFGIFLGTASHSFLHTDGAIREMMAENLLNGELALVQIDTGEVGADRGTPGIDGRQYSTYAIGQSLLEMPFIVAKNQLVKDGRLGQLLAGLFQPMPTMMTLTSALIPAFAFLLLRKLGYRNRSAFLTALVIAFCSTLWVVSGHTHNSVQETLGVFGSIAFVIWAQSEEKQRALRYLIGGAFLGLAFITRVSAVIAGPALAVLVLFRGEDRTWQDRIKDALWFGIGFTLVGSIQLAYNYLRFGKLFSSGYEHHTPNFMPPSFVKGLSWFVSPWRGMLIYMPVLWLVPFAIGKTYRKHRVLVISLGLLFLAYVVFYSSLTPLRAFWGWGSYYLMPAFLTILLPITDLFEDWSQYRKWQRGVIIGVIVLSIAVQLTTVSVPVEHHIIELSLVEPTVNQDQRIWTIRYAPLLANAETTLHNLTHLSNPGIYLEHLRTNNSQILLDRLFEFNLPDWQWLFLWLHGSEAVLFVPLYSLVSLAYIVRHLLNRNPVGEDGDALPDQ
jgi:hypothetical protein